MKFYLQCDWQWLGQTTKQQPPRNEISTFHQSWSKIFFFMTPSRLVAWLSGSQPKHLTTHSSINHTQILNEYIKLYHHIWLKWSSFNHFVIWSDIILGLKWRLFLTLQRNIVLILRRLSYPKQKTKSNLICTII